MSRRGGLGAGSGAIAAHLRAAGPAADPAETARYSLEAAAELRSVYAWDEAVEHAEAAVRLLDRACGPGGHAARRSPRGMPRLRSGRGYHEGVALLEMALRQYLRAGDEAAAGAVHSRIGGALCLHHSVMDVPRPWSTSRPPSACCPPPRRSTTCTGAGPTRPCSGCVPGCSARQRLGPRRSPRRSGGATSRCSPAGPRAGRRSTRVASPTPRRPGNGPGRPRTSWPTPTWAGRRSTPPRSLANAYLLDPETARAWCRRGLGQPRFTAFAHPHGAVVDQLALALAAMGDLEAARDAVERLPRGRRGEPDAALPRRAVGAGREVVGGGRGADESAGDLHDAALNLRWLATARLALGDDGGARAALGRALSLALRGTPGADRARRPRPSWPRCSRRTTTRPRQEHLARCEEILAGGERLVRGSRGRWSWHGRPSRPGAVTTRSPTTPRPALSTCSRPTGCPGAGRPRCSRGQGCWTVGARTPRR